MSSALLIASVLLAAAAPLPGQQQRDLKFERDPAAAPGPAAKVAIPRSYALVVGVAEYPKLPPAQHLRYPERDAEAVYSILISPEGGNFRAENVRKLTGSRATLAELRKALEEWLPSVTTDDDRVLIYFAGHGFLYQGRAYLAPYDFDPDNISGTGYRMDTLGSVFGGKIKGKWKVLLSDACHSGAIRPGENAAALNAALLDVDKSLLSFTASRDREQSFESPDWGGGHGIFTYYVVRALEGGADQNSDGIVDANELVDYVRRHVREATGGKQNPIESGSFDPNMLLSFHPSRVGPDAPPPPVSGGLVFETNMDGVEVFVNGQSAGVVNKGKPLRLPGLKPGVHVIKGTRLGYEPDGPREEMVFPGQETTVSLKIVIPRRRNRSAVDRFERGLEEYNKGTPAAYRRAAEEFKAALAADPEYSQAALYLGRVSRDLYEFDQAAKYLSRAIEIDPDYLEARATLGGMLLDQGNVDEAIRQFNAVLQRDRDHAMTLYLAAQAFRMKEMYKESIEAATRATRLTPKNAEAHFWLAESLRMTGKYAEARKAYLTYLELSDFDSKLAGKMNYYVLGFLVGMGKKKRAAQRDVWKDLRSLAYFGLCDSSRKQNDFTSAIGYCQRSLSYDPQEPFTHYALALSYARQAQDTGSLELLAAARRHFQSMIEINPELAEADYARKNVASIDAVLRSR